MKGYIRKAVIFAVIAGPIWFIIGILIYYDVIEIYYDGFALDSNGLLYISDSKGISVYENGEYVKTVFRKETFTIKDDKLYVAYAGKVDIMDLSGNLIETIDDSQSKELHRLSYRRYVFITDEAKYIATRKYGFYKITKYSDGESETIFQMPTLNYVISIFNIAIPVTGATILLIGRLMQLRLEHLGRNGKREET